MLNRHILLHRSEQMKKEYFSIPNLMGYFRILMLPVFLYMYFHADSGKDYIMAFLLLAVSLLTDLLDGWVARKFNMVTDFGKALDPVADKLTQGALAIAVASRHSFMIIFITFFICKEIYMGLMGLYLKKKKNFWSGAKLHGKICTVAVDAGVFVLLLFPQLPGTAANVIILLMMLCMAVSLVKYIQMHVSLLREASTDC